MGGQGGVPGIVADGGSAGVAVGASCRGAGQGAAWRGQTRGVGGVWARGACAGGRGKWSSAPVPLVRGAG